MTDEGILSMNFSRRTFLAAITGGAVAAVSTSRTSSAQDDTSWSAGLGLTQDEFEDAVGTGKEVDDLIEYPDPMLEGGRIYVAYRNGIVSHLELEFSNTADGGFTEDIAWNEIGSFAPTDATLLGAYHMGSMSMEGDTFLAHAAQSPMLGEVMGSSGTYVMTLEEGTGGDGGDKPPVVRATISAEAADVMTVTPTGDPGGLGATISAWNEAYGDSIVPQRGVRFEVPPFDQVLVQSDYGEPSTIVEIEALAETGISIDDAMATVGAWLPADAAQQGSSYLNPSPNGPIALRVQTWDLPTLGQQAMVMLYEEGPEDNANVSRIMMSVEDLGENPTGTSASPKSTLET